jgi:hypothetical protein
VAGKKVPIRMNYVTNILYENQCYQEPEVTFGLQSKYLSVLYDGDQKA